MEDFENQMSMRVEMDKRELEYERLDVKSHFVGNVRDRIDKFKLKNVLLIA